MEFKPFNLGNVLATGESIKTSRLNQQSQQQANQLKNTQILHGAATQIATDPGSAQYVIPELQKLGIMRPDFDFTVMAPEAIQQEAQKIADSTGKALQSMNTTQNAMSSETQTFNAFDKLSPEKKREYLGWKRAGKYEDFGGYMQGIDPLTNQPSGLKTDKTLAPDKTIDYLRDAERNKVIGKSEGESQTPSAQDANNTRYNDNVSVISDIDFLLSPRNDGNGPNFTYGYGRENRIAPDFVKPQTWIDAESIRDRIISNLQLENVKKLKGTGPITENEQKILKQAATVLGNPLISPALAEKELRRVKAMFRSWAASNKKAGVNTTTDQKPVTVKWSDL